MVVLESVIVGDYPGMFLVFDKEPNRGLALNLINRAIGLEGLKFIKDLQFNGLYFCHFGTYLLFEIRFLNKCCRLDFNDPLYIKDKLVGNFIDNPAYRDHLFEDYVGKGLI